MDTGLGWLGVVVGLVGAIATFGMARGSTLSESPGEAGIRLRTRWTVGVTLALTLIFWAIAMQKRMPFSPGQRLGLGFLIGGLSGAVAQIISCFLALASTDSDDKRVRLACHAVAFLALFGASLTYSLLHGDPQTAMIGFAVGAAISCILAYYSQGESPSAQYMKTWSVFAVTIAIGVWLSVAHFGSTELRNWWSLPILLATTALVSGFIATELRSIGNGSAILSGLGLTVICLGLSAIYSWKLVQDWSFLWVVAVGLVMAGIVSWLAGRLAADGETSGLDAASGVVLLAVAFTVAAFKLWAGLGIALGLLAAWTVVLSTGELQNGRSRALFGFAELGLVILLFRLFLEVQGGAIRAADLRIHYTFVGALLGAILPFTLISALARLTTDGKSSGKLTIQVALFGLLAVLIPVVLFLMWDVRCVMGLAFGFTAAAAFVLMMSLSTEKSLLKTTSIIPMVVGSQLAAVLFTNPLVQLELTRTVRIYVVGGVALIFIVWLVLDGVLSARRSR